MTALRVPAPQTAEDIDRRIADASELLNRELAKGLRGMPGPYARSLAFWTERRAALG
jgi:hypothetical protein